MRPRIIAALSALALLFGGAVASPANADIIWTAAPKAKSTKFQPIVHPISNGPTAKITYTRHYQTGFKDLNGAGAVNTGATSATTTVSQHTRTLDNGEGHTLFEVAALTDASTAGMRNIVEIGNNTSILVNGDSVTRLFGGLWVNGVFQGYPAANANSAGFVDNPAEAVSFHTALAVTAGGAAPSVFYEYKVARLTSTVCDAAHVASVSGWGVYQQNVGSARLIACAPDTLWTTAGETFTKIDEWQSFNELAHNSTAALFPCSPMGSGIFGVSTLPSAAMDLKSFAFAGAPVGTTVDWDAIQVTPAADTPSYYRVFDGAGYSPSTPARLRMGGPGNPAC